MWEILWSHIIIHTGIMAVQTITVVVAFLEVMKVPCIGPLGWVLLLCFMQGFCGISMGE